MPDSILTLPPPPYDLRIRYGDAPQHFADVRFQPTAASKPSPAIITVHGGYWRAKYDLAYMGHFCAALTRAGCVTLNLEYRRVGDPGGGWPGSFDDVRRAFDYVIDHADELRIDPTQITITGHSAGGQLALCLAAHQPRISKVVSLAGVIDLQRAWELHLSNDAVVEFLGGTPQQMPDRYRDASPLELAIPSTPQLIVHGANDNSVPIELSRRYTVAKTATHEKVHYLELEAADHFDVVDPRSSIWQQIQMSILG
jgi:acetyl esterase/lipase